MPNLGVPEMLILAVVMILIPVGIGYWCMSVFRRNGRSEGWGFALGFLLTFFLPLAGAILAVVITYTIGVPKSDKTFSASTRSEPGPPAPPVPPPPTT